MPAFSGNIPAAYHTLLGPMLFEPYARDLAARLRRAALPPDARVLELAAGTGIVTKCILDALPAPAQPSVGGGTPAPTVSAAALSTPSLAALVATDISEPMLALARSYLPADPRLTLAPADACSLPCAAQSFDALVCQFGVMFFPDKAQAMREARRVLRPRGVYLFNVWNSLAENPIAGAVHRELAAIFPASPPAFLSTPFGFSDTAQIERLLRAAGFTRVAIEDVRVPCTVPTAQHAARAFLEGTPLAVDLAERGADAAAVRARVAARLAADFGAAPCHAALSALVIEAR